MFYGNEEGGVSVCIEQLDNGRWLAVLRDDDVPAIVGTAQFKTLEQAQAWAVKATS